MSDAVTSSGTFCGLSIEDLALLPVWHWGHHLSRLLTYWLSPYFDKSFCLFVGDTGVGEIDLLIVVVTRVPHTLKSLTVVPLRLPVPNRFLFGTAENWGRLSGGRPGTMRSPLRCSVLKKDVVLVMHLCSLDCRA